jgi:hypothetical protein
LQPRQSVDEDKARSRVDYPTDDHLGGAIDEHQDRAHAIVPAQHGPPRLSVVTVKTGGGRRNHRRADELGSLGSSILLTAPIKGGRMRAVMVRYKLKADRVTENEEYISKVFDDLKREAPTHFRYAVFRLEDCVSFMHLVFEESEGNPSLADLPAFQAFVANIADRCDEPPVASAVTPVASYRLLDG